MNFFLPDASELLSAEESAVVQAKLWQLFKYRASCYLMNESTSMPESVAQELIKSICFTLGLALKAEQKSVRFLLDADFDALFRRGIRVIEANVSKAKRLWKIAKAGSPKIRNIYFEDTLNSISNFQKKYFHYYFAHEITCCIDYLLCTSVPEELLGVEYICEYLRRIIAENIFISCFEVQKVKSLLCRNNEHYKTMPLNLCEPVFINALGLALAGKEPRRLTLESSDCEKASAVIAIGDEAAIVQAAEQLCESLKISDTFAKRYFCNVAASQAIRLVSASEQGCLNNAFV